MKKPEYKMKDNPPRNGMCLFCKENWKTDRVFYSAMRHPLFFSLPAG